MAMTIDDNKILEHAISNLRKYQKIQEIVKSWEADTWTDGISEDCMEKIREVIEDENVMD